jgi:glycosyltransferase involved in cell wall biosynthesis
MMLSRPLISILTPVYNQSSYIGQTIRSVLNQTHRNWEWIILDDGSTDGTGDIINGVRDSRIRYVFQEHAGIDYLTQSRNKALALCDGDLIAMLDADDYWPEYKLEAQVRDFTSPDVVLSYGESIIVNRSGGKICYMTLPADRHIANNDPVGSSLKLLLLERNCFITNSTVMLKKSVISDIGGFLDVRGLAHDFTTWTRLSLEGRFAGKPFCLGYRRRHQSSTNYNRSPRVLFDCGIDFLRDFVVLNKQKLIDLGFFYDVDTLEAQWKKLNPYVHYYSRAIVALTSGSFTEGREAFKKFLEGDASSKQRLIYLTILLSSLIRFDLVNPLVSLKTRTEKMMRAACSKSRIFNRSKREFDTATGRSDSLSHRGISDHG